MSPIQTKNLPIPFYFFPFILSAYFLLTAFGVLCDCMSFSLIKAFIFGARNFHPRPYEKPAPKRVPEDAVDLWRRFLERASWVLYRYYTVYIDRHRARLVLGWVTVCGRVNHLGM